jgi:hypothetical protein
MEGDEVIADLGVRAMVVLLMVIAGIVACVFLVIMFFDQRDERFTKRSETWIPPTSGTRGPQ